MGNYEQLKQSVSDVIKTNGNQEITGSILQNVLLTIISSVGANATFAGIATPTTNPGTPDGPVFYLASESGTYSNFNAIELQDGLSILMWNGSWSSQQIFSVDDVPTAGSDNLVKSGGVTNLSLQKALIGLHATPASIYLSGGNLVINIPGYVYIDNITFNVSNTFTITAPENNTLTRIFLKKDGSEVVAKSYNQNFYDVGYALIGVLQIDNSGIQNSRSVFYGRYTLNGDSQHVYCFGCLLDVYTKSEAISLFKYDTAIVGLHTTPAVIDISSEGSTHTISFFVPYYIYTQKETFNLNKTFTTNVTASGLTRLFYNRTQDSIFCLAYNEFFIPTTDEVYFLGTFTINSNYDTLSMLQPIGRWSYRGNVISSTCPTGEINEMKEKVGLIPNQLTEDNMYMFVYDKIYLIESEEYRIFKDSLFFSKVDGFSKNNSEIVAQTDSDVNMGTSVVSFSSDSIIGYPSDSGISNIIGIYINSNVNINGINKYGVRCSAYVAKNLSGKSIRYTAIGDSQTDNGMFKAVRNYTNRKNFNVVGIGLLNDGVANTDNEGRSGWRYENIIGRSNAMGWGAIEVITPNGSVKNTTDFLHNNPFIRLATQSDKETYPTRCYTFTANQQASANYLEKSYAEVQQEGGDLTQNFYIFDIANYFTVQHDWDGVGNPVDAISFAFSTNEFIIEGFNQATINRLLDNVSWIIERCHEQLPNVKISFIACPAWSYNYNVEYKNWVLPWFESLCELIDTENVQNTYIVQPHIFMDRGGYAYNRGNSHSDISNNTSMTQKYPGTDTIHFDSVGYQQYAKAVAGWLANLV